MLNNTTIAITPGSVGHSHIRTLHLQTHIYIYIYIYVCMYVCMYIYIYICMHNITQHNIIQYSLSLYIYIYIYIYLHIGKHPVRGAARDRRRLLVARGCVWAC